MDVENLDTSRLPRPIYPPAWEQGNLITSPWLVSPDSFPDERDKAVALIRSGVDLEAATIVFNGCINDGIISFADARSCLEALRPVKKIREAVDSYHKVYLRSAPLIGLHVRHGNGGDIMGHASSWQSFHTAIERCKRAVEFARDRVGANAAVFLCADSADVETEIRTNISGVICRPKPYRPSGAGELHRGGAAAARLDDALIEMLLLARCNILIRYPAGSFFSFYAAVMKPTTAPSPATVRDLLTAFDPTDRLSPAVLF